MDYCYATISLYFSTEEKRDAARSIWPAAFRESVSSDAALIGLHYSTEDYVDSDRLDAHVGFLVDACKADLGDLRHVIDSATLWVFASTGESENSVLALSAQNLLWLSNLAANMVIDIWQHEDTREGGM